MLIAQSHHAGPGVATNHGAAHARFPFLAFIDDDCVPDTVWLAASSTAFEEAP
jgi:hypothetical protein